MRLLQPALLAALITALICGACADETTGPTPGHPAADTSFYLTMDDGVRIAVSVHLPVAYGDGSVDAILELTRYWRDRGDGLDEHVRQATLRGFAYVLMDERGTGASFGTWPWALTDRALEDVNAVLDWIVDQRWSSGHVGATGVSYPGMAAQQLAGLGHPALRAIAPRSDFWDLYSDLLFPGGMRNEYFIETWGGITEALDRNTTFTYDGDTWNLQPVDEDPDGTLLRQAVAGHGGNLVLQDVLDDVEFRGDPLDGAPPIDSMSSRFRTPRDDDVAIYDYGTWMDGASADGVIRQFMSDDRPRTAYIGSWTHSLDRSADPFEAEGSPADPNSRVAWSNILDFMETALNRDPHEAGSRNLWYRVMGAGYWANTGTWPVPGSVWHTLFLDSLGSLSSDTAAVDSASDHYVVDFTATTGAESRWHGPVTGTDWYPDRRQEDTKLLVYETEPLSEAWEVIGYAYVRLYLTTTETDAAVFVYLEDVAPDGTVRYLTEGELRLIHRKELDDPRSWAPPVPYHSYQADDAESMTPGRITEVGIGLQPVAARIEAGHRLRIAIAGHDAGAFARVPAEGAPELDVFHDRVRPSRLHVPAWEGPVADAGRASRP
jgi:putative CocE/NonD family hydrolase